MLRNMHNSTYLIFVHHEGKPIYKFSIVLRKCNYLDLSQIYKRHFNRFIDIFKHCWPRYVHGLTLRRPPYCVHKYIMPRTIRTRGSVAILAKIEIPGGLSAFCTATCGLRRYYIANLANFPIHKNNSKQ